MEKKDNIHKGHRKRMWKKYSEYGLDIFNEHEILEMLLYMFIPRVNTNRTAHELIDRFGSLKEVLNAPRGELLETDNIGESSAIQISFINDITGYINALLQARHFQKLRRYHRLLQGLFLRQGHGKSCGLSDRQEHACFQQSGLQVGKTGRRARLQRCRPPYIEKRVQFNSTRSQSPRRRRVFLKQRHVFHAKPIRAHERDKHKYPRPHCNTRHKRLFDPQQRRGFRYMVLNTR